MRPLHRRCGFGFIRPPNGSNSTCGPCHSECYPLLHYVSDSAITQNDSYFCFLPGNYDLTEIWTLKSVHYLSLVAPKDDSSQHNASAFLTCSGSHSGLTIEDVFGLTIMGLSFSSCGHIFQSESIASSVLLMYVWDLHMSGVEIHYSHGWGMYCYSLLGNSNISHTKINGGKQSLDWTGLNWNGGLDQSIVFAHAQTFKHECMFAPAPPKAPSMMHKIIE